MVGATETTGEEQAAITPQPEGIGLLRTTAAGPGTRTRPAASADGGPQDGRLKGPALGERTPPARSSGPHGWRCRGITACCAAWMGSASTEIALCVATIGTVRAAAKRSFKTVTFSSKFTDSGAPARASGALPFGTATTEGIDSTL